MTNGAAERRVVDRFDGAIAGFGSMSGVRVVLGMWHASPFGAVTDAMIERPDGHRMLIAPHTALADYISATYTFDEIRVEDVALEVDGEHRAVRSASLFAEIRVGARTPVGGLLRAVPPPLARTRWWARAIDPVASRLRDGVHTVGTAGGGRREYYCALDEHRLAEVRGHVDGVEFGRLRPVTPPVRFGFGSTPAAPSIVRVTTQIVRRTARQDEPLASRTA